MRRRRSGADTVKRVSTSGIGEVPEEVGDPRRAHDGVVIACAWGLDSKKKKSEVRLLGRGVRAIFGPATGDELVAQVSSIERCRTLRAVQHPGSSMETPLSLGPVV